MKPEELKKIAEAMGYTGYVYQLKETDKGSVRIHGRKANGCVFSPESNPAQIIAVIKWLVLHGWKLDAWCDDGFCFSLPRTSIFYHEKNLADAALQAALKQAEEV